MSDRCEEIECYECGRLKTRLIWKGRCVTCTVQRLESNLEENDTLRDENAALEVRLAELAEALEGILAVAERVDSWESFPRDPIEIAETALAAYRKEPVNEG